MTGGMAGGLFIVLLPQAHTDHRSALTSVHP